MRAVHQLCEYVLAMLNRFGAQNADAVVLDLVNPAGRWGFAGEGRHGSMNPSPGLVRRRSLVSMVIMLDAT